MGSLFIGRTRWNLRVLRGRLLVNGEPATSHADADARTIDVLHHPDPARFALRVAQAVASASATTNPAAAGAVPLLRDLNPLPEIPAE